jgi:Family of unknown function (DUF6527)
MKLTDLEPRWFDVPGVGGAIDGVTFLCPNCRHTRLAAQFANPMGTEPKPLMTDEEKLRHVHDLRTFDVPPGYLWTRSGETFEVLTLTPSINAEASGHWHGFVTNGGIVTCGPSPCSSRAP